MCEPVTIAMGAMAAVGVVSGAMDAKNQNKAVSMQEEARRKQLIEAVRQSNIADASLKLEDNDNYVRARQELEAESMSAIKAQGTVTVAMNESNLEGRSMERVERDVQNIALRTKGQINENYQRDYHNIWVQREANRDNVISQIKGSQPIRSPDKVGQALNVVQSGVQGAMVGQSLWGAVSADPNLQTNKSGKK